MIVNGLELEVGWMPKVISQSGNSKVQLGQPGYCDASAYIKSIGKKEKVDRSMGDVHAGGNPHYAISSIRMMDAVRKIKDCLLAVSPEDEELINSNFKKLEEEFQNFNARVKNKKFSKLFYVLHSEFDYITADFGLVVQRSLEKIPGVLPSAGHLTSMAIKAKSDKPAAVLASYTSSKKILRKFEELSGVRYIQLRLHPKVGEDYFKFVEYLYKELSAK